MNSPEDLRQLGKPLTKAEKRVMQEYVDAEHTRDIAARLDRDTRTIDFHLANVRAKLGVTTSRRALVLLVQQGVISL